MMKRRVVAMLLGGVVAAGIFGTGAQAMTYAYEYDAESAEAHMSREEKEKWENWHKEEMRQQLAYLEAYGINYEADTDTIYYQGKTVRWLIDKQIDDTYTAIRMPEGEIDVYTERGDAYELTGLRVATQEEYDEQTRKDEAAEPDLEQEEVEYDSEAYTSVGDILEPEEAVEGSKVYTFSVDIAESEETGYDSEANISAGDILELEEVEPGSITYFVREDAADADMAADTEEWRQREKEYEEAGITYDGISGSWMWQGKPVHLLMDENGAMYQNGSQKAKEEKIYILVTRDEKGRIEEARQVTMEEVLKERILQENE